jgi:putative resolvase
VILTGVKLSEWAGISGVSRQSASWWFHAGYLTAEGIVSSKVVSGVGSGLNGHRARQPAADASVGTVVAARRGRLARFGVEYLEAVLAAQGRKLMVVERAVVEVCTSFCARRYGCRPAQDRAGLAVAAAGGDQAA